MNKCCCPGDQAAAAAASTGLDGDAGWKQQQRKSEGKADEDENWRRRPAQRGLLSTLLGDGRHGDYKG